MTMCELGIEGLLGRLLRRLESPDIDYVVQQVLFAFHGLATSIVSLFVQH